MEKFWMEHQDFFPNIETWWGEMPNLYGTKMFQFQQRLKHVKLQLKKWNKEVFGMPTNNGGQSRVLRLLLYPIFITII
jgi:hypothetical protein